MARVLCSVDGCNARLQPLQKPDPQDRETWAYPECDLCFRPACAKHSSEIDGKIVCDRCRREKGLGQQPLELVDLGIRSHRAENGDTPP